MTTRLDHIVIAASSLSQGVDYINELFGIQISNGGRHEMMGTHNKVMPLGNGVYLEVIAVNPEMEAPEQPRWFGLDDPYIKRTLDNGPRLLTWAVNSNNLEAIVKSSNVELGSIKHAQRDNLEWNVAITEDGRMPAAGFIPLSIEWLVDFHPSEKMQDLGCKFESLTLCHPKPNWLFDALKSIGASKLVTIKPVDINVPAYMELRLTGPRGEVLISN